jgi:predicted nucleotide-binding protein
MDNEAPKINLVKDLSKAVDMVHRMYKSPSSDAIQIKRAYLHLLSPLKKIFGSDSELTREFNNLFSRASVTDYKARLQQMLAFGAGILDVLENESLKRALKSQNKLSGLTKVFVGHGHNPIWSRIVIYLEHELKLTVEAYEMETRTSSHIVDILKGFLDSCDAAVILMTSDDMTIEGIGRARQNVIHEIGLFQGRHDFDKVILIQERGTEDLSNLAGLQPIYYSERIEEALYELGRAIRKIQENS